MGKRIIAFATAISLAFGLAPANAFAAGGEYPYNPPDTDYFVWYHGDYDPDAYPQNELESEFTADEVFLDGFKDDAYGCAISSPISKLKKIGASGADSNTSGSFLSVWDGALLYLLVEVKDETKARDETIPDGAKNPIIPIAADSVNFAIDFYNDKTWYETDTAGVFNISSSGAISYFENQSIPSLGSVFSPNHPEHLNRIAGYAVAETEGGYNIEVAIALGERAFEESPSIGVDIQISDAASVLIPEVPEHEEPNPFYPWFGGSPTILVPAQPEHMEITRIANVFWSHEQDSIYTEYDNERPKSIDWGNVALAGASESLFKSSPWQIEEIIRFTNSASFPTGVYTEESQNAFDSALSDARNALSEYNQAFELIKDRLVSGQSLAVTGYLPNSVAGRLNTASANLKEAFDSLRWADTKYPDPAELPDLYTLPNPYKFFQSDRLVESLDDWEERRAEILDLAQFYEYGYKPGDPDSLEITSIEHVNAGEMVYVEFWPGYGTYTPAICSQDAVTISIAANGNASSLAFTVYLPTDEELEAAGHDKGSVPVVLSYDGDNADYRSKGFAVASVPPASGGDGRTNEYAWGARTGTFYELYPYARNGSGALSEVSSEMAAAWSASRVIDALENLAQEGNSTSAEIIDPENLAVAGFSINGKYAFVAGVFDSRIDVVMPGAAGATGPSPWRYIYMGHEYDWSGTEYADAPGASPYQIASGTEMLANSVRHNRVREIELFRRFMTPGHFYERKDGAYGFASRLPFDQSDLAATLAGRAIVLFNTVDDYNDGSEADPLGLEAAKAVYSALGYDADALVKFNLRGIRGINGVDPHGTEQAQFLRAAEYLDYYFYGNEMSEETGEYLNQNPFLLPISNSQTQSPYDYYYGGFNTITGGVDGIDGTDGWYFYRFKLYVEELRLSGEETVKAGQSITLSAEMQPENADDITLSWTSSDENVAQVDANGVVTGKKAGKAVISASANGAKIAGSVTAEHEITVTEDPIYAEEISISVPSSIKAGESQALSFEISPVDATDKTATWTSSDESVAQVDANGVVTGKKAGKAVISASANGAKIAGSVTAEHEITVIEDPIYAEAISISGPSSIKAGESQALSFEVTPVDATDKTATWTSSDESVAQVDADGVVTGKKAGSAVITASANGALEAGSVTSRFSIAVLAEEDEAEPAGPSVYVPSTSAAPLDISAVLNTNGKDASDKANTGAGEQLSNGPVSVFFSDSLLKEWNASDDGKITVTLNRMSESAVLDSAYNLTSVVESKQFYKSIQPIRITFDISSLPDYSKNDLTGVKYDDGNMNSFSKLGGMLSNDKKYFTFYAYDNSAIYGLKTSNDLIKIKLMIGKSEYTLNNSIKTGDVAPYIDSDSGRTMVPLRFISESLGAQVDWRFTSSGAIYVSISYSGQVLGLTTGQALPNGLGIPVIEASSGRTMVPARYILEALGANVVWNADSREVDIFK
ncbi:MAG: Ig-like domain-containing protein [Clostridiales bacterium]|jgi:uncharacterized protein YjdB|nr:Ig-like domain-containing protein [Clostridiales bacterium]